MIVRRIFDVCIAGIVLTLLAIPLLFIAAAVKVSSPGPVFFLQKRVGRGGRLFWLYKFRTMYTANSGPQVTAGNDARITPLGKLLRGSKIDELPQILNVLLGQMTIIGPRPEVERYVRHYTPEQHRILDQTPGLAGMGQLAFAHEAELLKACSTPEEVEAVYVEQIMPRKLAIDLNYEQRRSFLTDMGLAVRILLSIIGFNSSIDREFHIIQPANRNFKSNSTRIAQQTEA